MKVTFKQVFTITERLDDLSDHYWYPSSALWLCRHRQRDDNSTIIRSIEDTKIRKTSGYKVCYDCKHKKCIIDEN